MKQKRSHLQSLVVIAFLCLMFATTAHADVTLGTFNFNSSQFGNTLTESDGGTHSAIHWLNTTNADPGNPAYLTGANFETGIANIGTLVSTAVSYTIGYATPIVNNSGADFGVVVARYSTDNFYLALSDDGTIFTADHLILSSSATGTGVGKTYYYGGSGPFSSELFVHSIDISDFGFAAGTTIEAVRITGIVELDLIRAAGFAATPLPGAFWLMGSGLVGLAGWRRCRKS
jgi:hypothetical protein